ncbi:MAG: hypothetical protein R3F07_08860 [Opitutaceae bacterium]
MNLKKTTQIAEIISAVALILSLVYVAFELRRNTATMRMNARIESQRVFYTFNDLNLQHPELLELGARMYDPTGSLEALSESERLWLVLFMRSLNQRYEELYIRYQAGFLGADAWERYRTVYAFQVSNYPICKEFWAIDRPIMSPDFRENIESASMRLPLKTAP